MLHNILIFSWFSCCSRRAPEPQKPQARVGDDVVRSNHYDPDDDEEYYRKQLSFFDRRSFDSKAMNPPIAGVNRFHEPPKPPQTQIAYPFARYPLTEMQHVFTVFMNMTHLLYLLQDGVCGEGESCGQEIRASAASQPFTCSIRSEHTCCSAHIPAQTHQHRG